jgi:tetratricopeptide (TPR) repeat protein
VTQRHYHLLAFGLGLSLVAAPSGARADALDDLSKQLVKLDAESKDLGSGIKKPTKTVRKDDVMTRRLIDAQVSFGTGNFEEAALILYDYVNQAQAKSSRDYDTALYYLGESLFQKGDRVAARSYFTELVKDVGSKSKFYQQSLERLIELSLILRDGDGVDAWLAALDAVPADKRNPSVPYVRGKYAFSLEQWDEAAAFFAQVPTDSEYALQAQYYLGTTQTAKLDLGAATKTFAALVKREPKTEDEIRVVELAQLALGRLYYERDQPTKAIDSYLLLDRKSPLFDEALYEVAWVYVKAKHFDKALRALELLALADPTSTKLPTVALLEGNLRIRKAQTIKGQMVMGVDQGKGNPVEEYLKADDVFARTHKTYEEPHDQLAKIIEEGRDPREFMVQITGRVSKTFEVNSTMPEIAASWIRDEPDVERIVVIESDLGEIQDNITEAERTIDRLDAALSRTNRVNVFPSLAEKAQRSTEILESLLTIRTKLADQERAIARKHASGAELTQLDKLLAERQRIAKLLAELPNAGVAYGERIARARSEFDELDQTAAEVQVVIETTEATMVALQKYINEVDPPPSPEQRAHAEKEIAELAIELEQMRNELESIRRETTLGRDEAGTGDEVAEREEQLRKELRAAFDAEHKAMAAAAARATGADKTKADRIKKMTKTVTDVTTRLDKMNQTIDEIVEEALVEVQASLTHEKAELASYRREFLLYEAESRELGGTVLGSAFRDVKARFYDVLVRTDVGVVDVSWSQKEDTDEDLRRLELDKSREVKQLRDEFRDLIEEEPAPAPEGGTP